MESVDFKITHRDLRIMLVERDVYAYSFQKSYERYKGRGGAKFSERIIAYICPVVNVVLVLGLLFMAFAPDDFVEEVNKHEEDR